MTAPTVTCPAWCVDCYEDSDGVLYHHSTRVALPDAGYMQAVATAEPGQPPSEPVFQIYSHEDRQRTREEVQAFGEAVLAFVKRFPPDPTPGRPIPTAPWC